VITNGSRHRGNLDAIITGLWISGVIHDDVDIIRLSHLPSTSPLRLSSTPSVVYDDISTRTSHRLTFDVDLGGSESISERPLVGIGRTSDHRHDRQRILTFIIIIVKTSQNAGFLIAHNTRGMKIGFTLAKSYLIYAPKLGESLGLSQSLALLLSADLVRVAVARWGSRVNGERGRG
jgi:hypothetical protein